jgi:uncharacterized membrane protein YfcA
MKGIIRNIQSFFTGLIVGVLGGLIGLGGGEFRLPVLVGYFKFTTLQGIVINLFVSLITVVFSFIFRSSSIPIAGIGANIHVVVNLLAGSIIGVLIGSRLATRISHKNLNNVVFSFMLFLGIFMMAHSLIHFNYLDLLPVIRISLGFVTGIAIGIFSSMLGVAGGELIIPSIIILFAIDIKLAGSLSLCVSFPTVLSGIIKYIQKGQFITIRNNLSLVICMAIGSVIGAFIGSRLLIGISATTLQVILGFILLISAMKIFRDR